MSIPAEPRLLFFGCWGEAGHYMWSKNKKMVSSSECQAWGFPSDHMIDGSKLLLPRDDVDGQGCRTYLPAWHLTVLSWWNRVYDSRGNVNSHFLFKGRNGTELMWDAFCHNFPELSKMHIKPIITEQY